MKTLIFLIGLLSCSKKIPDWFLNPPLEKNVYYGIGSSYSNYEDAKSKALQDISSQIKVQLSSTNYQSTIENSRGLSSESFSQFVDMKSDVNISKYNIIDKRFSNDIYYILLSLKKEDLIFDLSNLISSIKIKSEEDMNIINYSSNILERLNASNEALIELKKLKNAINLLSSIDKAYNTATDRKIITNVENLIRKFKKEISFVVDCKDPLIKSKLISQISSMGFLVNKKSSSKSDKNTIFIDVEMSESEENLYGYYVYRLTLNLRFYNKEAEFYSQTISQNGSSSVGYQKAKESAISSILLNGGAFFFNSI